MIVDVTKNLQNPLRKPSELTADEIEELKSYDATSYSMRRIGLPVSSNFASADFRKIKTYNF